MKPARSLLSVSGAALLLLLLFGVSPAARARRALPIRFTVAATPAPARPGEVVTVTVKAVVDPGWHVYSVVPTPDGPATTAITSLGAWAAVGPTTEDAATRKLDPNFGKEVGYHEGAATFSRQFRAPSGPVEASAAPLSLGLHYQTCNDKICLPPTDVVLPASVPIVAGAVRQAYANAAPYPPSGHLSPTGLGERPVASGPAASRGDVPAPATSPSPRLGGRGAEGGEGDFSLFLLAALGAGLLAIVTPCVFPLIPITLTNFVKQAGGSQAKLVRLSFGYALGIVALYVGLGAACAALLGGRANNIAANPWVNLVEFVLFVVFALSFFETIQITLPANLGALQQSARKHGGTAGLVLLGVTFVLGSFTCTAPFVGTLLVSAAGGQWLRPLLGMLVFALAFASPFFVFALFPQWIGRIPKGGVWLARFKATLGFVELAAALKFLSNADQVWQWKLITQPVLLAAWAVVFFCAALYLWGTLRFGIVAETEAAHAPVPLSRRLTASAFALAALYCFWGLTGRAISPYVAAFLPPSGYGGVAMAATNDGLPWLSDYGAALAQAKAEGRPLLIDFTGYTCTNCRLNEKNVFPRPAVQAQLANYVRVQLYTDGKNDAANQKLQETKFGDIALPLYGIVDPQTGAVLDKTEGVQTVGGFTRFLAKSARNPRSAFGTFPPADGEKGQSRNAVSASPGGLLAGQEAGDLSYRPFSPSAGGKVPKADRGPSPPLWQPYSPAAAQAAATAGRPVVIDFTAKWCVNCHEIEHDVFENPAVKPTLGSDFVTLRADLTQWTSPASAALEKQYGFGALPTIVFLDRTGAEIKSLRITGRLPVADFQKRMAAATAH